jgi:hypothetical protein
MLKRHKDFIDKKNKRAAKIAGDKITRYKQAGEKIVKGESKE